MRLAASTARMSVSWSGLFITAHTPQQNRDSSACRPIRSGSCLTEPYMSGPVLFLMGANFTEHPAFRTSGSDPMTGKITIEQKWHQQSEAAKNEAEKLPHGRERESRVKKTRQPR